MGVVTVIFSATPTRAIGFIQRVFLLANMFIIYTRLSRNRTHTFGFGDHYATIITMNLKMRSTTSAADFAMVQFSFYADGCGGNRTLNPLQAQDFKSCSYASSDTHPTRHQIFIALPSRRPATKLARWDSNSRYINDYVVCCWCLFKNLIKEF